MRHDWSDGGIAFCRNVGCSVQRMPGMSQWREGPGMSWIPTSQRRMQPCVGATAVPKEGLVRCACGGEHESETEDCIHGVSLAPCMDCPECENEVTA